MPQSSLVFVAIVAVWVLVLLPLWVANRETVGEARTDDRDSENLRVLSRRERVEQGAGRPSSMPLIATVPVSNRSGHASSRQQGMSSPNLARTSQRAAARRARVLLGLVGFTMISWLATVLPGISWGWAVPATLLLLGDLIALIVTARARARTRARRELAASVYHRIQQADANVRRQQAAQVSAVDPEVARPVWSQLLASTHPAGDAQAAPSATWTPRPVPRPTYMLKTVIERPEQHVPDDLPGAVPAVAEVSSTPVLSVVPDPVAPVIGEPLAEPVGTAAATRDPRPWEREHTWADDLDLMLARRRAVGS